MKAFLIILCLFITQQDTTKVDTLKIKKQDLQYKSLNTKLDSILIKLKRLKTDTTRRKN